MNAIRIAITVFILLLIGVSVAGWQWTGAHQNASQAAASRAVLLVGALAGVVGLGVIWRHGRPGRP
jgi:hypothetical protein